MAELHAAPALVGLMEIEVVWADADSRAHTAVVSLPHGASMAQALQLAQQQSGHTFADDQPTGIWGKDKPRHTVLEQGDRVELYQPLLVDPKRARRERFAKQGARGAGLFAKRRPNAKPGY